MKGVIGDDSTSGPNINMLALKCKLITLQVSKYAGQRVNKKQAGFGDQAKVLISTFQVYLCDPKLYNQVTSVLYS